MFGGDVLAWRGRELLGAWAERSPTADVAYMVLCAFLVCFAGLMSGLTLGLMSMDIVELEVLRRSGSEQEARQAARIIPVVKDAHFLLVTLLLCNAMAMEALPIFLDKLMSEVAAILVSVTAVLFAGEIMPQALCAKHGLAIGSAMAIPVRVLMLLASPIAFPIAKLLDWVLGGEHASLFRRKQLKALVTLHAKDEGFGGRLTTDEIQIITGALDLTRKTAYHAMTPLDKVFMLSSEQKLDDATISAVMAAKPFSRLPVYRGQNKQDIVGVILVKELLEYVKVFPDAAVASMKVRQLPRLSADTPMYDLLKLFRIGRSHMALLTQPHPESTHASSDGTSMLGSNSTGFHVPDYHGHGWRSQHPNARAVQQLETVHEGNSPFISQTACVHASHDSRHHPAGAAHLHTSIDPQAALLGGIQLSSTQSHPGPTADGDTAVQSGQSRGLASMLMRGVRMLGPQDTKAEVGRSGQEDGESELQPMLAADRSMLTQAADSAMAMHSSQWLAAPSAFAAAAEMPFAHGQAHQRSTMQHGGGSEQPGSSTRGGYAPSNMPMTAAVLEDAAAKAMPKPGTRSAARSLGSLHNRVGKDAGLSAIESAGAVDNDRPSGQPSRRTQRKKRRSKRNRPIGPGSTGTTDAAYDTMELGMPQSSAALSVLGGSSPPPEREPSLHSTGLSSAVYRIKSSLSQLVRVGDVNDAGPTGEAGAQPVGPSSLGFGSGSSSSSSTGSGGSSRDDLEDMLPVPMIAHPGEPIGIITIEDVIEELMGVEILDETDRFVDNEQSIPISPGTGLEELPQHLRAVLAVAERAKNQVLAPRPTNWLLRATATVSAGSASAQGPNLPATSVLADLAGSVWRHAFRPAQAHGSKELGAALAGPLRPGSPPRRGMQDAATGAGGAPAMGGSMDASSGMWASMGGVGLGGMSAQNSATLPLLAKGSDVLAVPRAEIHAATVAAAVLGAPRQKTSYANWKMYERLRTGSGTLTRHSRSLTPSGLATPSAAVPSAGASAAVL